MYKDPTEFRARFKAYKEGKMPYENGLPKFAGGTPGLTSTQQAALDDMYNYFNPLGYDIISISGMGGNGLLESGLNPDIVSKSGYAGVWQNNKNLQNAIKDMYGDHSKDNLFRYANAWVNGDRLIRKGKHAAHTALGSGKFKKAGYKTAEEAADAWLKNYERAVILDSNGKVIGYQDQGKRKAFAKAAYNYLSGKYGKGLTAVVPEPIIEQAVSTAVRNTIPAEQTHTTWEGAQDVSPYLTNKPLLILNPRITVPSVTEPPMLYNSWFENRRSNNIRKMMDNTLSLLFNDEDPDDLLYAKDGKLPHFEDGKIKDMKLEDKKDLMWYAKPFAWKYITNYLPIDTIRERLYNNLIPVSYKTDKYPWVRARDAIVNNEKESLENFDERQRAGALARDEIYAQYLHIPKSKRRGIGFELEDAKYRPTLNDNGEHYYSINFGEAGDEVRKAIINNAMKTSAVLDDGIDADGYSDFYNLPGLLPNQVKSSIVLNDLLGWHRVGRAIDPKKGDYISYWDRWDLTPVGRSGKDLSMGIGTPVNIYDRIYLDDYYGVDSSAPKGTYYGGYLPEIEILPKHNNGKLPKYKNGKSPIHIKPANRGKFTALKKRTGHSASWFKENGTPAQKKMATFALNAKKWKH